MQITKWFTIVSVGVLGSALALGADDGKNGSKNIFEFQTMTPVVRPFTGSANPIRGVNGGGLPWVLSSGHGVLGGNGRLHLMVRGLVLDPNDSAVISRGLAGINPFNSFNAIVSCKTVDMNGAATTMNVMTGSFPATSGPASMGGGGLRT